MYKMWIMQNIYSYSVDRSSRVCLKNAFCKMCITICGRFRLNEGGVVGYGNRMKAKYTVNWGVQIAGMIFQTRSSINTIYIDYNLSYLSLLPFALSTGYFASFCVIFIFTISSTSNSSLSKRF